MVIQTCRTIDDLMPRHTTQRIHTPAMFATKRKADEAPVEAQVQFTPAKRMKQGATEFEDEKKARWKQDMEELGAAFQKAVPDSPLEDTDRMNLIVAEYLRAGNGNVMAMGSDDSWALGAHNDSDAEKEMEYPPIFTHSLRKRRNYGPAIK